MLPKKTERGQKKPTSSKIACFWQAFYGIYLIFLCYIILIFISKFYFLKVLLLLLLLPCPLFHHKLEYSIIAKTICYYHLIWMNKLHKQSPKICEKTVHITFHNIWPISYYLVISCCLSPIKHNITVAEYNSSTLVFTYKTPNSV